MSLWTQWYCVVAPLRAACSRQRSFLWLLVALAGLCARRDLLGVTSIVRTLGLAAHCYDRLLDFFHSPAVDVAVLTRLWTQRALALFPVYRLAGRPVLLGDGIKIPKSGRKMPAVKHLHQESEGNTKPEYIMGHSIQVISMLVTADTSFFAVPLAGRIHEGVKFTNRDQRTLPTKFANLLDSLAIAEPIYLVADAYYACQQIALRLQRTDSYLISRVRRSTAAYQPAPVERGPRKRGRPRRYGQKVKLWTLFDSPAQAWQSAASPVYGERGVTLRWLCLDLLWRPMRQRVRFVLVDHPTRGRMILITTDLSMSAIDVVRLYGLRFKIELSFKQALRVLGVYAYHFWMRAMPKIARPSGTQHLHRKSASYRDAVRRKLGAYHRHIQIGLIAQGILQYLAVSCPHLVWASFGSWLRTIRPGIPPSELVTAAALRNSLPDFLAERHTAPLFKKFLQERIDADNYEALRLTG
jgi:DDE superfamily endonuclease